MHTRSYDRTARLLGAATLSLIFAEFGVSVPLRGAASMRPPRLLFVPRAVVCLERAVLFPCFALWLCFASTFCARMASAFLAVVCARRSKRSFSSPSNLVLRADGRLVIVRRGGRAACRHLHVKSFTQPPFSAVARSAATFFSPSTRTRLTCSSFSVEMPYLRVPRIKATPRCFGRGGAPCLPVHRAVVCRVLALVMF